MKTGAIAIILTMIVVPALGYSLKKISDHGETIAVNTNKITNSENNISEMKSDIKDLLRAQGVKSSYAEKQK